MGTGTQGQTIYAEDVWDEAEIINQWAGVGTLTINPEWLARYRPNEVAVDQFFAVEPARPAVQ